MAFGFPQISFIGAPFPALCPGHSGLGFRRAGPFDAGAVQAHLLGLSPEDRRLRFCGGVSDSALAAHVAGLWRSRTFVLIAREGSLWPGPLHRAGPVRAVADFAVDGRTAELGLSVEDAWRRSGVGTWLLQAGAALLDWRGVEQIEAMTLPGNLSMRRLGARCGARIEPGPDQLVLRFEVEALHRAYVARRLTAPLAFARCA